MGIKVVKFGGSSLADAEQFRKVAEIVKSDPDRRFVVASAPGKRYRDDVKVTDMLYHCYDMVRNHEDITAYYAQIAERYNNIIRELGLQFDISGELDYIRNAITHHSGRDFAASRGEYLNSLILAKYLGFDFIDAESVVFFRENGVYDEEKTKREMREELSKKVVLLRDERNERLREIGKQNKLVRQIIDLALLSNGMLKGKNLSDFIQRSITLIEK
jgi:aspartate kinase